MKALVIVEDDLDSRLWLRNLPDVPPIRQKRGKHSPVLGEGSRPNPLYEVFSLRTPW